MIKIKINTSNNNIDYLEIKGHANSAKANDKFDLVCGAVSAVSVGILNYLKLDEFDVEMREGFISIKVLKHSKENEQTLRILETSLKTIEEGNEKYISIITKEV